MNQVKIEREVAGRVIVCAKYFVEAVEEGAVILFWLRGRGGTYNGGMWILMIRLRTFGN
jgi:hypothetical protein